jgi:hypothetical protein
MVPASGAVEKMLKSGGGRPKKQGIRENLHQTMAKLARQLKSRLTADNSPAIDLLRAAGLAALSLMVLVFAVLIWDACTDRAINVSIDTAINFCIVFVAATVVLIAGAARLMDLTRRLDAGRVFAWEATMAAPTTVLPRSTTLDLVTPPPRFV